MSMNQLTRSETATKRFLFGEDDDFDTETEASIEWSNLIFLPFHPMFKIIILLCVVVKCTLGPLQSVYPIVYCYDVMDDNLYLSLIKYYYLYFSDTLYAVDTFLHIVHRQVTDKAMRREYLPKGAFLLLVDIFSLVPFVRIVLAEECPPTLLWPNVLAFSEFVIIYRVVDFFSLLTTHSIFKLIGGFTLLLLLVLNCTTCLFLLVTYEGICENCNARYPFYDWRSHVEDKLNETDENITTYVYASAFIFNFAINSNIGDTKAVALHEFITSNFLVAFGYMFTLLVVLPKAFAESALRLIKICTYYPIYKRLVEETKKRNPSPKASEEIDQFFQLMWIKRKGMYRTPKMFYELPRNLRIDIEEDLEWPIFYHSPLLRKVSSPMRRLLGTLIVLDYKLPDEKLYTGIDAYSRVYYIKSGIVQILSADDASTALVSATSGTVFGDVSFQIPPMKRKTIVRCLTFCEILYLSRADYIQTLHKCPEDRRVLLNLVKDRMEHARTLYSCKLNVRGLDRTEDEGIAWIKKRWWEISNTVNVFKRKAASKKDIGSFEIPPEESVYHCAKYIGHLVLCTDSQLKTKSLFANTKFPWIFLPDTEFNRIWHKLVSITVFAVLLVYPPNITSVKSLPPWFKVFQFWTDFVYCFDIGVSLLTAMSVDDSHMTNFASVMFTRCKTLYFILDLLAALWIEYIVLIIGKGQFFNLVQINRILKIYILFTGSNASMHISHDPTILVTSNFVLIVFSFIYLEAHILYALSQFTSNISVNYFFGEFSCVGVLDGQCEPGGDSPIGIALAYFFEFFYSESDDGGLINVCIELFLKFMLFFVIVFCKTAFIAVIYLKVSDSVSFQSFVANLKKHYMYFKVHSDLWLRLEKYLKCHWKYYKGMDLLHPNLLKEEPYDVYWKVQGEVAEKYIAESSPFKFADPLLIRELAYAGKYMLLPKKATLFLFNVECKTVTWIVRGYIKGEYCDEVGEVLSIYFGPGRLLNMGSVYMDLRSPRTYTAKTDCEILYMKQRVFFEIYRKYPHEWKYLQNCVEEFAPRLSKSINYFFNKYDRYLKHQMEQLSLLNASSSMETFNRHKALDAYNQTPHRVMDLTSNVWDKPESQFICNWMTFRAFSVFVSIVCACLRGGSGMEYSYSLYLISTLCDCIACMDICLKMFLAYRDERGILITSKTKCVIHYLSRGFVLDMIGAMPWHQLLLHVTKSEITEEEISLLNTACKFAHLYILFCYFNYTGDTPNVNVAFIQIVKWQTISVLIMLGVSQYLSQCCILHKFIKNNESEIWVMERRNSCWLPQTRGYDSDKPSIYQMHLLYAESLLLAHCGLIGANHDEFTINKEDRTIGYLLCAISGFYWFVTNYSVTLLILNSKGNTLYRHGVHQLKHFLSSERVEPTLITNVTAHFTYWWKRTKGINIHQMTHERIGIVLRQDLNYYFCEKTLIALDTLLQGGPAVSRSIASNCFQTYMLPNQEIVREFDIIEHVYVVHRGMVAISKGPDRLATLTKGCIFGHLNGEDSRPSHISAKADDFADLLQITSKMFQEIINDKVRAKIASNPQSQNDYMATRKPFLEDPHDTVQYLIGGEKTLKFPFILKPVVARQNKWYALYLMVAWLIAPFCSVFVSLLWMTFPEENKLNLYSEQFLPLFIILDAIHMVNFITEFFTMEMVVLNKACVRRVIGWRRLKNWRLYVDVMALFMPMTIYFIDKWSLHICCILRLRLCWDYQKVFCHGFESKFAPVLMKIFGLVLLLHSMACGWIAIVCREDTFELEINPSAKLSIDQSVWVLPDERIGGCIIRSKNDSCITPRHWQHDYIIAFNHIVTLYVQTELSKAVSYKLSHLYYKLFLNIMIYFLMLYIESAAISYMFTKLRELFQYDYKVRCLNLFLQLSKISPVLVKSVTQYSVHLWARQRGNWLPELAAQAPMCLREDLMCALYVHHLETPTLFKELPPYFVRQLAARLNRIVVFPGEFIVRAGDIFSCLYFVHEGEVEKWYVESSGESKMMSLLSTNGYFGLISGLFPNVAFQFSYVARTVADLVYLRLSDWQDLLDVYPDVKKNLYNAAKLQKKDFGTAYAYATGIE